MKSTVEGSPGARWALMSRFTISKNGSLYLDRRRLIQTPWFGVYLHHIARPDLDRDPHNHPWRFGTLILRGGYTEDFRATASLPVSTFTREWDRWSWHAVPLQAAHKITRVAPNTWTLVFVGRRVRDWGFWTDARFVPWRTYIEEQAVTETAAEGKSRTWPTS